MLKELHVLLKHIHVHFPLCLCDRYTFDNIKHSIQSVADFPKNDKWMPSDCWQHVTLICVLYVKLCLSHYRLFEYVM